MGAKKKTAEEKAAEKAKKQEEKAAKAAKKADQADKKAQAKKQKEEAKEENDSQAAKLDNKADEPVETETKSTKADENDLSEPIASKQRKVNDGSKMKVDSAEPIKVSVRGRERRARSKAPVLDEKYDLDVEEEEFSDEEFEAVLLKEASKKSAKAASKSPAKGGKRGKDGKKAPAAEKPEKTGKTAKPNKPDKKGKKEEKKDGKKDDKKGAKKEEKAAIMDVEQTKKKIEEFMLRNNRPFSVVDILNNFQSSMRKKQAEQATEELVASGVLSLKEYGKAKVFLISQDRFPETDPKELEKMDEDITASRETVRGLQEELSGLEKDLKAQISQMTNEELVAQLAKIKANNSSLEERVEGFKSGGIELISEDQINEAMKKKTRYLQNWRKLKRECVEILDLFSESADMKLKDFMEKLGLETDEEYGADLKALSAAK